MSEEYIETILVECDRESANTKSAENNAQWTNNFNDTLQLNAGDQVSVYSSFVCDRGATQPNSVEFKGQRYNQFKDIKYTTETTTDRTYSSTNNQIKDLQVKYTTDTSTTTESVQAKDNEVNIVINYYKTMDCLSYIQLPRRFIPDTSNLTLLDDIDKKLWNMEDSVDMGRVNREPYDVGTGKDVSNVYGYVVEDYKPIYRKEPRSVDADRNTWNMQIDRWVLKNDNSKFTIMRKNKTYHYPKRFNYGPAPIGTAPTEYWVNMPDDNDDKIVWDYEAQYYLPPYYVREPESYNYEIYREKIKLDLPVGFNSSQFISEDITKQFRDTKIDNPDKEILGFGNQSSTTDPNPQIPFNLSLTAQNKTYKVFPCTNDKNFNQERYDRCVNNSDPPGNFGRAGPTILSDYPIPGEPGNRSFVVESSCDFFGSAWYEALEYIAVKRPEIYEAGSKLNAIYGYRTAPQDQTGASLQTTGLITHIPYRKDILDLFKEFFETQTQYPELFSKENVMNMYEDTGTETGNPYYHKLSADQGDPGYLSQDESITMNATIDNARYLHMNMYDSFRMANVVGPNDNAFDSFDKIKRAAPLGCSYYDFMGTRYNNGRDEYNFPDPVNPETAPDLTVKRQSLPFFTYYDKSQKDTYYDSPDGVNSLGRKLTYGCFGRDPATQYVIIYPNLLKKSDNTGCGLPPELYANTGGIIEGQRKFGFDRHWNAWGNCAIALTSGIPTRSRFATESGNNTIYEYELGTMGNSIQVDGANHGEPGEPAFNTRLGQTDINIFNDKLYLGAPFPELGFDGSHFFFDKLHNELNAGDLDNSSVGKDTTLPPRLVYKINPPQKYNNYSPAQFPYEKPFTYDYNDATQGTDQSRTYMNKNIEPYAVYDTSCGIFIEDLGISQAGWEGSLWNRIGFTYEQFNSTENDRLKRHGDQPDKIKYITTNAKIDAVDTKAWAHNQFQGPIYDGSLAHTYNLTLRLQDSGSGHIGIYYPQFPQIQSFTESIKITAKEYPIKSFKGYFAIRSDIIPTTDYIGGARGNTNMAIVGLIDKMNPYGDFFTGSETGIVFTLTKPMTIASVSVAITDPDGTYSVVSERSSIVFKINKRRVLRTDVAETIMKRLKGSGISETEEPLTSP